MDQLGVLIIGAGKIALANHLPGIALSPQARVVALCDADANTLAAAAKQTEISRTYSDYRQALADPEVDACIIATPNFTHPPIVIAAAEAGKHILCEKPLALDAGTAHQMYQAAQRANVRHMTAFTYRFVPAMRYVEHLIKTGAIGRVIHFRAQRFQDWGDRALGWRQVQKLAGTGELGDMLSHRIDYAHFMVGRMRRIVADMQTFIPQRGGQPSDVDDWVAMIANFENGATGVLESTKLATGRGEGYGGRDDVEVNGEEGSLVASTQSPNEIRIGRKGNADLETLPVPQEFLVWPGSPRDPSQGDPRVAFRYDQAYEFIDAILNERPCRPSLREGAATQTIMDGIVQSQREKRWIDVKYAD